MLGAGIGIVLIAVGVMLAIFANLTLGVILMVVGALALVLGFAAPGPWGRRRTVIVERERPVEREVVRERPVEREVVRERPARRTTERDRGAP